MERTAEVTWSGNLKEGKGKISTQSKALTNTPYGFNTRFEDGPGTNPEELIGAAHAGCFSMALAAQLGEAGFTADRIHTQAAVTLVKEGDGFTITAIHLTTRATIPGVAAEQFKQIADAVKSQCPVSKVLNATISLDAQLE